MWLLGLIAAGLGLGYMQHKSVQNINNMRANTERLYGNASIANWEHKKYAEKNLREVLKFFNERFDYYLKNPDAIPTDKYPIEAREQLKGEAAEYVLRAVSGYYAFKDMNAKWAPNYEEMHRLNGLSCNSPECGDWNNIANIARANTRIEIYNLGGLPGHMTTRLQPLRGKDLYFRPSALANDAPPLLYDIREIIGDPKWNNSVWVCRWGKDYWKYYAKEPLTGVCERNMENFIELKKQGKIK